MAANRQETGDNKPGVKKYIIAVLLLSSICAISAATWGILQFLNRPLSPPMEITKLPPTPTLITALPPTEPTSFCSETGSMLIIVLGIDLPETDYPKGADGIRFIKVDFSNQEVSILAIPRDLWVSTPILTIQGIDAERLGQTYFIGKNLAVSSENEVRIGTSVLTQTFYDNFGLLPDHYVALNMETFAVMISSLGGVNINIPEDFDGGRFSFSAGEQQINGDMLMDYYRTLLIGTEWDRLDRQDIVLQALKAKILSASILPEMSAFFSRFNDVVTTDLSPQQFINLGCMIQNVSDENIQFVEIPPDMVSYDSNNHMLPDRGRIISLIHDLFND